MERRWFVLLAAIAGFGIQSCAQLPSDLAKIGGWTALIDGEHGLENWTRVGDANWRAEDGAIVAYRGKGGYLVSKGLYKDFELRAEFWADPTTNSGIFFRVTNPKRIGADNAYEVNISDRDPAYGTGALVKYAKVAQAPKAGGKWNTVEITAKGQQLVVVLNGVQTVNIQHAKFARGALALEYGANGKNAEGGPIKFRKVAIKPLEEAKPVSGGGSAAR